MAALRHERRKAARRSHQHQEHLLPTKEKAVHSGWKELPNQGWKKCRKKKFGLTNGRTQRYHEEMGE